MLIDCLNFIEIDRKGKIDGRFERPIGNAHLVVHSPLFATDVLTYPGYAEYGFVDNDRDILLPDSRKLDRDDKLTLALVNFNRRSPNAHARARYRPNADDQ